MDSNGKVEPNEKSVNEHGELIKQTAMEEGKDKELIYDDSNDAKVTNDNDEEDNNSDEKRDDELRKKRKRENDEGNLNDNINDDDDTLSLPSSTSNDKDHVNIKDASVIISSFNDTQPVLSLQSTDKNDEKQSDTSTSKRMKRLTKGDDSDTSDPLLSHVTIPSLLSSPLHNVNDNGHAVVSVEYQHPRSPVRVSSSSSLTSNSSEDELEHLTKEELIKKIKAMKNSNAVPANGIAAMSSPPIKTLMSSPRKPNSPILGMDSSPKVDRTVLHPAIHTVHSNHGVRRLKLGRTSSIATMSELSKLPTERAEDSLDMITQMFRSNYSSNYLQSAAFGDALIEICKKVSKIFEMEKRTLDIKSPVYVFGDLHGNTEDLKFFSEHVWPLGVSLTAGSFLYLGDYVDRGLGSIEVVAYLFAQKIMNPDKVFMLRGNHETRTVNGWEDYYREGSFIWQCKNKFGAEKGTKVWEACNDAFNYLPLAATIDKVIFCVHGGIPRPIDSDPVGKDGKRIDSRLERINAIPCPIDIQQPQANPNPHNRLAFTLIWSDPADTSQERYLEPTGFGNSARGSGSVVFGKQAVNEFLDSYGFKYILRAHEATASGIEVSKNAKVLTVFSTSKDHGCGSDAKCGYLLVDHSRILAINKSNEFAPTPLGRSSPIRNWQNVALGSPRQQQQILPSSFSLSQDMLNTPKYGKKENTVATSTSITAAATTQPNEVTEKTN